MTDFDVIVVGAGVSGINAGYRLQEQSPDLSYTILEGRHAIGGTWDLFKYPGIRSDSDLHTFGFPWRPWTAPNTIAPASAIKQYVVDSAKAFGIDKHIQYGHQVKKVSWSTPSKSWTAEVDAEGKPKTITARFIVYASGYYDYKTPLQVKIPGIENFKGKVIHPQFWPEDLDYTGKNIVVIGSGATAITLIPNLAEKASHVTMLQRSPGYIMSLPQKDPMGEFFKLFLPASWAFWLIRLKFLTLPFMFFQFCRAYPGAARWIMTKLTAKDLPSGYPMNPNFNPKYNPWEQRLCVCPDGDFFKILSSGKASITTAHIEKVTENRILLKDSDEVLQPDIIVTATGLKMLMVGGTQVIVDGKEVDVSEKFIWNGALIQDVPNAALIVGYTNASWTLGADATSQLVSRLLNTMKANGQKSVIPRVPADTSMKTLPLLNLNSTYVVEAKGVLPHAGSEAPWLPRTSYFFDVNQARNGSITHDLEYA